MSTLPLEEVHIWCAHQPLTPRPELEATLSSDECERADRFHFAKHRLAYQFAHAVLRDVLGRYLHRPPRDIRFAENAFGKPFLHETNGGKMPEFSLSHAGRMVLVGLCRGRRIGVDIEEIRPIGDTSAIAESHFTPQECAFIFDQKPANREHAFFRCWTRKEAYVKAVGKGLSIPLNSFNTQISHGKPAGFLESGPASTDGATWQLADLDLSKDYAAAVAVESGIGRLVYSEWDTSATKQLDC